MLERNAIGIYSLEQLLNGTRSRACGVGLTIKDETDRI